MYIDMQVSSADPQAPIYLNRVEAVEIAMQQVHTVLISIATTQWLQNHFCMFAASIEILHRI